MITGGAASIVIIGNSNLTAGGLFKNYEAGTCFELNLDEEADVEIHEAVTQNIQLLQHDETCRHRDRILYNYNPAVDQTVGRL